MASKKTEEKNSSGENFIVATWHYIEDETERLIGFIRYECLLMEKAKQIIEELSSLLSNMGTFFHEEPTLGGLVTLLLWIFYCYIFEMWMIPLVVPFIFLRQFVLMRLGHIAIDGDEYKPQTQVEDKSITEMLQEFNNLSDTIDKGIETTASLITITKRTLHFKEPKILCIVLFISMATSSILYCIPLRYFIIFGSVYLFSKNYLAVNGYLKTEEEVIGEKIEEEMKKT